MEYSTLDDAPKTSKQSSKANPTTSSTGEPRSKSPEEIAAAYAEVVDGIERWRRLDELFAGRYRRRQFESAAGSVLDVACGTGRNFQCLTDASEIVGIDICGDMLAYASDELDSLATSGAVRQMDAQDLEFPRDRFDTVISSFSTCTFPDPIAALGEMRRVCKPGGRILLLEHSRSDLGPLAWLQDWRTDAHYQKAGCQLNHEPVRTVQKSDVTIVGVDTSFFGLVTQIDAIPGEDKRQSAHTRRETGHDRAAGDTPVVEADE